MVGPDDSGKSDNHVNERGFRHEGEEFFRWLRDSGIRPGEFFILCGDRHWKFHSQHALGFDEFCSGAMSRENARLGVAIAPRDQKSTSSPGVKVLYTDAKASGGFLHVAVRTSAAHSLARIEFTHHDVGGEVLYRHVQNATTR